MSQEVQSEILSEEQVSQVVEGVEPTQEAPTLPSEEATDNLILDKFKSQEDLIAAYKELESKLGKPTEETPPDVTPDTKDDVDPEYAKWKEEKKQNELLAPVGGKEVYDAAVAWAKDNLTEEQITQYNADLAEFEGNDKAVGLLVEKMVDTYKLATTKPTPTTIHSSETSKVAPPVGYATKSEMMKDMGDSRYYKDPSYRALVEQKIAITDQGKWYQGLPNY